MKRALLSSEMGFATLHLQHTSQTQVLESILTAQDLNATEVTAKYAVAMKLEILGVPLKLWTLVEIFRFVEGMDNRQHAKRW